MLTSSFPSVGPILKFVMELMDQVTIQISDFKTPEFYSKLLQVLIKQFKHFTKFELNFPYL